jgi:hypothetical protein
MMDWFGEDRVTECCRLPGSMGDGILLGIGLLKNPATELVVNLAGSSVIIEKL